MLLGLPFFVIGFMDCRIKIHALELLTLRQIDLDNQFSVIY